MKGRIKEFCEFVGVSQTSIRKYINGRVPRQQIINKIIEYSQKMVSIEDFYQNHILSSSNTPSDIYPTTPSVQ